MIFFFLILVMYLLHVSSFMIKIQGSEHLCIKSCLKRFSFFCAEAASEARRYRVYENPWSPASAADISVVVHCCISGLISSFQTKGHYITSTIK
uniref:Transcription factor EMB1444-like isoform X1 n=1 Tax=Rhizophora mucronata TaxID=61149 RepID=A0A2P2KUI7_RHIMU